MDGKIHHFSAGGLYNGLVLLIDDETGTYWDHITGEAVHGPLAGAKLEAWGVELAHARAALKRYPQLRLHRSDRRIMAGLAGWGFERFMQGRLPPHFRSTMGEADSRLPEMEIGLGVVADSSRRFYPLRRVQEGIEDVLAGRKIQVGIDPESRVPYATWADGTRPLQLFTRWYGFAYTFPGCEIYGEDRADSE